MSSNIEKLKEKLNQLQQLSNPSSKDIANIKRLTKRIENPDKYINAYKKREDKTKETYNNLSQEEKEYIDTKRKKQGKERWIKIKSDADKFETFKSKLREANLGKTVSEETKKKLGLKSKQYYNSLSLEKKQKLISTRTNWSFEEDNLLKSNWYINITKEELKALFPSRTMQSIGTRASQLNLPKRNNVEEEKQKESYTFISHIDQTKHKTISGLFNWNKKKHNISAEETITHMTYNGQRPTCKCGCGGLTNRLNGELKFKDYQKGHLARVHNPTRDNPEIAKKAIAKANKIHCEGLKDGTVKQWNDGLTKENSEEVRKLSEIRKGKKLEEWLKDPTKASKIKKKLSRHMKKRAKTDPYFNAHMKIYWKDEDNRSLQSNRRIVFMKLNSYKSSKLETDFGKKLSEAGIDHISQFKIKFENFKRFYDFKIKGKKILIEVDGDFWHCNPKVFSEPTHLVQKKHIENDKLKNRIAKEKGYKLLRFWENDIKNGLDFISIIKEEIEKGE